MQGGTVTCWGANNAGQLGNGTSAARELSHPGPRAQLESARLRSATEFTCVILGGGGDGGSGDGGGSGAVECWGLNGYGMLGNGTFALSRSPFRYRG